MAINNPSSGGGGGTPGQNNVGYMNIPQIIVEADYETLLTDSGKHLYHPATDVDPRTITIPANGDVAYPIGTAITIINEDGAGDLTITSTDALSSAGTVGDITLQANNVATLIKVDTTRWLVTTGSVSAFAGLEPRTSDYTADATNSGKLWMRTDGASPVVKAVIEYETTTPGTAINAINFNGNSSMYVEGVNVTLPVNNLISLWINWNGNTSDQKFVMFGEGLGRPQFSIGNNNYWGGFDLSYYFPTGDTGLIYPRPTPNVNHHILAGVVNSLPYYYIDGVAKSSSSGSFSPPSAGGTYYNTNIDIGGIRNAGQYTQGIIHSAALINDNTGPSISALDVGALANELYSNGPGYDLMTSSIAGNVEHYYVIGVSGAGKGTDHGINPINLTTLNGVDDTDIVEFATTPPVTGPVYSVETILPRADGVGVPAGGDAGQILAKIDGTNYNTEWIDAPTGGGGGGQYTLQDYAGQNVIGVLGEYVAPSTGTITEVTFVADSIPTGSNATIELRKNSYTTGSILTSALTIATTDTLTNGKIQVSTTDFTNDAIADGDYFVAYLTSVGSTLPITNARLIITTG